MSRTLSIGRSVLVSGVYRSATGAAFDPDGPVLRVKRNGVEQAQPALSRTKPDSTGAGDGHYYAVVRLSAAGEWRFRYEADGDVAPSPVSVVNVEPDGF
jgi:hypothetical protein